MNPVEALLADIDQQWKPTGSGRIPLKMLGSSALFLHCDYRRGTKDGDVLETAAVSGEVAEQIKALAGQGSDICKRHRMYLDVVPKFLPLLPPEPLWWPLPELSKQLRHFDVEVLDYVDVAISKLPRFKGSDRADILAVVQRRLIDHAEFVDRFRLALDHWLMDARAEEFPRYVENFHTVEREHFGVEESEIDLPSWISDE
jgi:hypothetical protein